MILLGAASFAVAGCPSTEEETDTNATSDSSDPGTSSGQPGSTGVMTDSGSDTDSGTDAGTDSGPGTDTDPGTATDGDTEGSTDTDGQMGWTIHGHACPGINRTDALHRDDDGTLWVGCGTAATGYGLFYSEDGGPTWTETMVDPEDKLFQLRVNSISRGHDGALYVAGINANNSDMVLRIDTDASPFAAESVLIGGNQIGTSFHVGTYRELSDGRALAESLNGTDMLFRPDASTGSDAATWTDTYGWFNGGAVQILDLVVHDDQFYGVGSRISDPPRIFLPPTGGGEPYEFVTVEMDYPQGELWGIAVSDQHVVAVGMDQNANVGRVYVSGADPYDAEGYTAHALHDLIGADASQVTWARGTCIQDDRIAVVGERQPLGASTGIIVLSEDGGQTFTDITPDEVSATASKCLFTPEGALIVAGADGFIGIYE